MWVDSFTSDAFGGNPAAVCFLPGERDASWMKNVAAEMNLAETAFLRPLDGEGGRREFELRWFTPKVEVDLCGHATLASAHALWETGRLAPGETARFHTRSGVLTADPLIEAEGSGNAGAGNGAAATGRARRRVDSTELSWSRRTTP